MNYLDIIIGIPLLWAAYKGFRDGIALQLGGIAGILVGVFVAYRYAGMVGGWIGLDGIAGKATGFILLLLAVMIALSLLGHLIRGVFRFAGLGALDSVGGVLLGVVKMGLLLSVLLLLFDTFNARQGWVPEEKTRGSLLYNPVKSVSSVVFPYVEFVKDRFL